MKQAKWYLLTGVLAFLIALVVYLPASVAWRYAQPYLKLPPQVKVIDLRGTIWNGEVLLGYREWYRGQLDWVMWPLNLLWGSDALHLELSGLDHQVTADVGIDWSGTLSSRMNGRLEPSVINPLLADFNSTMSGSVALNDLKLALSHDGVTDAGGTVTWQGGDTTYRMGTQRYDIEYPPLLGQLEQNGGNVQFNIAESRAAPPIVSIVIQRDGWAEVKVMKRITQVVKDLPLRRPPSGEGVMLSIKEKVF